MRELADALIGPIILVLQQGVNWLKDAGHITRVGFNPENFLSVFSVLGVHWINLIKHIFISGYILVLVYMATRLFALYSKVKDGVKWW